MGRRWWKAYRQPIFMILFDAFTRAHSTQEIENLKIWESGTGRWRQEQDQDSGAVEN